jgi:thiosulfate/3-mercaptopyruvate sulfurtransferase
MGYFQPDVLVSTDWVEEHKKDKDVRIVEVDVDTKAYEEGHIEGSIAWNWQTQLCDPVVRDLVPKPSLETLLEEAGIDNSTTIVLYGDNNNWFACWAFWQLKIYGHENVRIMNGGRKKWITETKPLTQDVPTFPKSKYQANEPDWNIRAYLSDVQTAVGDPKWALVDVRSPDEFTGKILAPPGLPETCQRGGHIPGAQSIPWGKNCNEDGTFKSADELASLYETAGVTRDKSVIAYCRIGERSSLSWFVLQHLLGYPKVVNYDGSWTEWGNLVNAPVAR